jgi:flagellar biosynthetic protein FliR
MPVSQLQNLLADVPLFVLVLSRVGAMMLFAPLFGSARIPKRVRALIALMLTMGMLGGLHRPAHLPATLGEAVVGLGGELAFGLAMGMVLSFVFIAAQWAGELIGQQIGFNIAESFDPQFGAASTVVGDMYYMLTLVIFLEVGGHRQIVAGLRDSFDSMPVLTVGVDASVFDIVRRAFTAATLLAARLAAPVLVTMLVLDLTLGFLGKTMPQLNIMAAGLSLKAMVGIGVITLGIALFTTQSVLVDALTDSLREARLMWAGRG